MSDLRMIPWARVPVTPLPDVWESNSDFAWMEFDEAVRTQDANTPDGRAKALAEQGASV